jgi:hypothetical protein
LIEASSSRLSSSSGNGPGASAIEAPLIPGSDAGG